MKLSELPIGHSGTVTAVGGEGALRQHFLDMGLIPGAEVTAVKLAPMGDPLELRLHGYELTLRLADAAEIGIEPLADPKPRASSRKQREAPHPGLGEEGKFHPPGSAARRRSSISSPDRTSTSVISRA